MVALSEEKLWEKFWARVEVTGFCWNWTGALSPQGYGTVARSKKLMKTHRVVYEHLVGPIGEGLVLDHLCRNIICLNPDHLEPVTVQENNRRGFSIQAINLRKTHCPQGHEYSGRNVYGFRICKPCRRDSDRKRRSKSSQLTA